MRILTFVLSLVIFVVAYLMEGGQLGVLIQPIELIMFWPVFLILFSKYGFSRTLKTLFTSYSDETSYLICRDGVSLSWLTGAVAAIVGIVITMGKLTEGKEVIGHSIAAAMVAIVFSAVWSLFFIAVSDGKKSVAKPGVIAGQSAVLVGIGLFFMIFVLWLVG